MGVATVFLVGAGPGDPDLLTVKALRLLRRADAVVYDRLVSEPILELIPKGTSRIYVGKADGRHHMPQAQINELLLKLARAGRKVVRLKGGDPYVFGRGGEEAEFLVRHGVPFEVVPGITAAAGCSAYAGIPLTHRGLANGVQLVTGHGCDDRPLPIDWRRLNRPDTTLVIYMGLHDLGRTCRELMAGGLAPATPAAGIENGTTPRQRRVVSTLAELPEAVRRAELDSPCVFIIGRVVDLADTLDWFVPQPTRTEVARRGTAGA